MPNFLLKHQFNLVCIMIVFLLCGWDGLRSDLDRKAFDTAMSRDGHHRKPYNIQMAGHDTCRAMVPEYGPDDKYIGDSQKIFYVKVSEQHDFVERCYRLPNRITYTTERVEPLPNIGPMISGLLFLMLLSLRAQSRHARGSSSL
jgi:hypothetical protein